MWGYLDDLGETFLATLADLAHGVHSPHAPIVTGLSPAFSLCLTKSTFVVCLPVSCVIFISSVQAFWEQEVAGYIVSRKKICPSPIVP